MKKQKRGSRQLVRHMGWDNWALVAIVVITTLGITIALCAQVNASPQHRAEKELKQLADDYYTLYLYPRLLGSLDADPAEAMQPYLQIGTPTTYLRQLLNYSDEVDPNATKVFSELKCNTNATGVRYYPVEPYGPRDYTVRYTWRCEKGEFPED